jgi:uncharacterized membrane protein HdeD (DUF308 family)
MMPAGEAVSTRRDLLKTEILWMRIVGVLLIVLGLALFAARRISYTTKEKVIHSGSVDLTATRYKSIGIPRAAALLIVGAGVIVLVFAGRKTRG